MSDCDPTDCITPGFPVLHHFPSLLKFMSVELVMPSKHLFLCRPLLLLPSMFPSIKIFPGGTSGKESTCQCRKWKRHGFDLWVRNIPWNRKWQPTPIFLPGKSDGKRSLAGDSWWGQKESDTQSDRATEQRYPLRVVFLYPLWQMMERGREGLHYCTGTAASREQGRMAMGASAAHADALTTLHFCWPWTHSPRWLMRIGPFLKISSHFPIPSLSLSIFWSSLLSCLTLYLPPPPVPWKWTALKQSISSLTLFSFGASSESSLAKSEA